MTMRSKGSTIAFYSVLSIFVGWFLGIPLFPSQDGPVYLYYAHVFSRILDGSKTYSEFFGIKSFVQPAMTHLYLLVLLNKILSPTWADKLVALISFLSIPLGCRFLIKSGKSGDPAIAIFAIPLALSWPLFMGFYNYVLGIGLAMFAAGLWCRGVAEAKLKYWAAFYLLVLVLAATHPLPLVGLACFCGAEWVTQHSQSKFFKRASSRFEAISGILLALVLLLIVRVIASRHYKSFPADQNTRFSFSGIFAANAISPLQGSSSVPFRLLFFMLLFFNFQCATFGIVNRIRLKKLQISDLFLFFSVVLVFAVPFLPFEINGTGYVAQRLLFPVWIASLVSAGLNLIPKPGERRLITISGLIFALLFLGMNTIVLTPVLNEIQNRPIVEGRTSVPGLLVARSKAPIENRLAFDPFYYSGLRLFAASDIVWMNTPWLTAPSGVSGILKSKYAHLEEMSGPQGEVDMHPIYMLDRISSTPSLQTELRNVTKVLLIEGAKGLDSIEEEKLRSFMTGQEWDCRATGFYELCVKK